MLDDYLHYKEEVLGKCGSHAAGNGLIGDRERDVSSRENSPRACSPLLPVSCK